MIKAAVGLSRRAIEAVTESPPEFFADYPFAEDLKLGWYPSKSFFQRGCEEAFYKALPDVSCALVAPYYADFGQLSHLIIAPYKDDGTLNHRRKRLLSARTRSRRQPAGILGIHRLRTQLGTITVTDDEVTVAKHSHAIAVTAVTERIGEIIKRSAPVVDLKSDDPRWIENMYRLSGCGIQVLVNGKPLPQHIKDQIVALVHDGLGLAVLTKRFADLVRHLVPLERVAVIQMVKDATNIDLERALPDDFSIYRREAEFYDMVVASLDRRIKEVELTEAGLALTTMDDDVYRVPITTFAIQGAICQIMDARLDLLDWVYRDLKEVPSFYVYRGDHMECRAAVCEKIAQVVITVLSRRARIKR